MSKIGQCKIWSWSCVKGSHFIWQWIPDWVQLDKITPLFRETRHKTVLHKVGPIGKNETEESSTALGSNADVLQWAADRHMAYCWMWPAALNGLKIEMSDAFACSPVCALRWSECTDRHSVGIRTDKSTDGTLVTLLHTSVTSLNESGRFQALLWSPVDTILITWTRIKNRKLSNCHALLHLTLPQSHNHVVWRVWGSRT